MSIDISVSNKTQKNCDNIIEKLLKAGIEARVIETTSVFENNIEKGCLLTLSKEYNTPKNITNVWNTISSDYTCAHIKIKALFDGCIFDYFKLNNTSNCPHNKSSDSLSCRSEYVNCLL